MVAVGARCGLGNYAALLCVFAGVPFRFHNGEVWVGRPVCAHVCLAAYNVSTFPGL